ncbi:MAG: FAD-dependent oxidoreductase [Pseudomonadota bacterium]
MSAQPDSPEACLWHATADETFSSETLKDDQTADLIIIGGGILGLSTALHAARGGLNTVLLEASVIGAGASGRNGGLVVPSLPRVGPIQAKAALGPAGERLVDMIANGARYVFDLIAEHKIACDAVPSGWLHPAHAASLVPKLQARMAEWQSAGASLTWLDAEEARDRIGSKRFHGAILDRTGGHLNPLAYSRGLARAATEAGALIHERSPVTSLKRHDGMWRVATAAGSATAPLVIQATNAQVPGLGTRTGKTVSRSTLPLTVYQMATAPLSDAVRASLLPGRESLSDTRNNLFAIRWTADHRLVIGGMPFFTQADGARRVARSAIRRLNELFPQLALDQMEYVWRGQATLTGDFLPRLFQPAEGWLAPIACNGRGIVLTTALGRALAKFAADGNKSTLPLPLSTPRPIRSRSVAKLAPQLLLPLGAIADRRAERRPA